ncbi:hypothetical protein [Curvibacter phage PCA1]|nr:hypothetical protein [Curvibacter phage PCA1]
MLFRCPACRTRRSDYKLFTQHLRTSGHKLCNCGGYHYAHRPGSPFCEQNPMGDVLVAARYGATDDELLDIAAEVAFTKQGKTSVECPF